MGEKTQESAGNSQESAGVPTFTSIYEAPEYKEVVAESIKRKERIRELEAEDEKRKQAQLVADGKKDELIESLNEKISELSPLAENYKSAVEKLNAIQEETLQEVLKGFPEDQRSNYKDVKDISLLRQIQKDFLNKNIPQVDGSSPSGTVSGYNSAAEAAQAYATKQIDLPTYQKIKQAFSQRFGQ